MSRTRTPTMSLSLLDAIRDGKVEKVYASLTAPKTSRPSVEFALWRMVVDNKTELVQALVQRGVDMTCRFEELTSDTHDPFPEHLSSLLHFARSPEMVSILCLAGLDVNAKNYWERTALGSYLLWVNSREVSPDIISCLIKHGVHQNNADVFGYTPKILCLVNEMIKEIAVWGSIANIFNVDLTQSERAGLELMRGCKAGDLSAISRALDAGANPSFLFNDAARLTISDEKIDCLRLLIGAGLNVNLDSLDWPEHAALLAKAVRRSSQMAIKALLDAGAAVSFPSLHGDPLESCFAPTLGVNERKEIRALIQDARARDGVVQAQSTGFMSRDFHYVIAFIEGDLDSLAPCLSAHGQATSVPMGALANHVAPPGSWVIVPDPGGPWCRAIALGITHEPTQSDVERWSRITGQRTILVTNDDTAGLTAMLIHRNGEVIEDFDADSSRGTVLYKVEGKSKKVAWTNCSAFLDKRMKALRLSCIQDLSNPMMPSLTDVANSYSDREKALLVTCTT